MMKNEIKKKMMFLLGAVIITAAGLGGQEAGAEAKRGTEASYKGATLRFIVPTAPGGIFDMLARKAAPSLEKYSGARVIVENMPGAGGLVGGSYIYSSAKPDGLTVGLFNTTGMALYESMELPTVKYKLDRYTYICRTDMLNQMLFTSKVSGFKTITDMQKATKTIRFGVTEPSSAGAVACALFIEAFGLNAKIVPGYKGIREILLAVAVGRELDAAITTSAGLTDFNQINVTAAWNDKRRPAFPDVPTALETPGLKPEGRRLLELGSFLGHIGRMVLAPPDVSDAKRQFLERIFLASLKEPDMPDWALNSDCNLAPLPGKESKELVFKVMAYIPKPERPQFKNMITKKYYF